MFPRGCGASKAISSDSNGGFKQEATDFATKDQPTKPSFTEPPSSDQKTLDEKLRSGELLMRHRRGGVSSERVQAKTEDAASDAHTIFASRIKSAGDTEKDPKTRAMLLCATSSCVLFKGMSDTQIDMIIDVRAPPRHRVLAPASHSLHVWSLLPKAKPVSGRVPGCR